MIENQSILIVSITKLDSILIEVIERETGKKCIELYKYNQITRVSNFKRHIECFLMAFKALRLRKGKSGIIFWQQFIGLYYSFLCNLFLIRKAPRSIILTVIYVRRFGFTGNLYHRFFKMAFHSKYIDKLICHSSTERNYYLNEFGQTSAKALTGFDKRVVFCKLGEGLISPYNLSKSKKKYFFSGGSSNRDYVTLINAFNDLDEQLIIACKPENIGNSIIPSNVTVLHNAYGEDFINLIKNSYSIVLPINDPTISSGQLVLLNAMRFGKSTIVTGGNCMNDYIDKKYSIEVSAKSVEDIRNAVSILSNNPELNESMSRSAYNSYIESYSIDKYAKRIAGLIV